ncbi:hypothetical protein RFI_16065 [Reticulomyxa filosa]|uniref:Uncharacterized protein n=1 Tax=Reticulomyxa filosa TaxID=46433 RepID=X6N4C6_RETFI|nr:hypothetical protein RFI_16065 [Reticulomyxa filosa]|eukprot:ETO21140.1 hypothetical protein RFI_16065 [Reticulomyxa filosa]
MIICPMSSTSGYFTNVALPKHKLNQLNMILLIKQLLCILFETKWLKVAFTHLKDDALILKKLLDALFKSSVYVILIQHIFGLLKNTSCSFSYETFSKKMVKNSQSIQFKAKYSMSITFFVIEQTNIFGWIILKIEKTKNIKVLEVREFRYERMFVSQFFDKYPTVANVGQVEISFKKERSISYTLVYRLDVASIYTNIILINRLQPVTMVNDEIFAPTQANINIKKKFCLFYMYVLLKKKSNNEKDRIRKKKKLLYDSMQLAYIVF